jgi:CRP-like cAMP-binding protein
MNGNSHDNNAVGSAFRNLTLSALPETCLVKLTPHLQPIDLPQGSVLITPERSIQWIYFLEHGMCSMTNLNAAGTPVEVGIIGREGLIGAPMLLGQPRTLNRMIMQGAGSGFRARADSMRSFLAETPELLAPLHNFVYALLEQTTQLVLCNRLHSLESRLARWLLMTSDFMESRSLRLTQEYLAEMLGVGRPAVTIAAGTLQRAGILVYSRGLIEIANRELLTASACECYRIIRDTYKRVYPELF